MPVCIILYSLCSMRSLPATASCLSRRSLTETDRGVLSSRNEMETDDELLCFEFEIVAMELYMIPQV